MFRYFHLQNLTLELFTNYFFTIIRKFTITTQEILHCYTKSPVYRRTNYAKHTLANKRIEVWNTESF